MCTGEYPPFGSEVFFILTSTSSTFWRLLQITDSSFPTGGFAHSNGLEAAIQHGEIQSHDDLENFLTEALWQWGYASLPLANAAFLNPESFRECDDFSETFLSNHVAKRASTTQGRTFLATCEKAFAPDLGFLNAARNYHFHYAPVYGAMMRTLGLDQELMQKSFFYITLRGMLSASVRLGVIGPYQGQQMQTRISITLDKVLLTCRNFTLEDVAQTAPLLDIYQNNQDRLYSRLFQS